jgi:23S rRNA (adenine2503-C2)-methyltransferase
VAIIHRQSGQVVTLKVLADSGKSTSRTLFGLDRVGLTALAASLEEPAYRGTQLAEALYRRRVVTLEEITTLPRAFRDRLAAEGWQIGRPTLAETFSSIDGTERYLVACGSETVETVWMPEGDDGEAGDGTNSAQAENASVPPMPGAPSLRRTSGATMGKREPQPASATEDPNPADGRWHRATICISSQVGCAVNCRFCLTAKLGLQRNLTAGEIAGQVVAVLDRQEVEVGRDRVNLVFMGMGEPFLNYDAFMAAVRLLVTEVGLSPQRMTVSTSGIVPGIGRFAEEPQQFRPKLAISLNAPNDVVREQLMPINRKWNIESLVDAVQRVKLRPRERITFEYVLLGGVTDQPSHAHEVARLLRHTGLSVKVNLIAWNPGPGIAYRMPSAASVEAFRNILAAEGIPVYLRRPRGRDIYAACGQLKRTVEG